MAAKPAGIDMERNYVTVTLCITVILSFYRIVLLLFIMHRPMFIVLILTAYEWLPPFAADV